MCIWFGPCIEVEAHVHSLLFLNVMLVFSVNAGGMQGTIRTNFGIVGLFALSGDAQVCQGKVVLYGVGGANLS